MNKLVKKIIGATSVCALVLGMVLGANALAKKGEVKVVEKTLATPQWHFNGATNPANNDLADPTQYSLGSSSSCDGKKATICNLEAPENGSSGQPDLTAMVTLPGAPSQTISQRINDALTTGNPNETVKSFRSE
ncbi:hypothetical protein KO02_22245 [Sphingobacterium sp. ML3W]|uniref:hypothetical protein n=1 Tax=Sphingobacterium sp. ML3W TaxID=1538644 RepID=UPI0004F7AEE1|nr:hypothetical protein [Sphingobacterium sp. ML3W]AIM39100.1 hypothetical protein KO02_22245 [Sphingobacterium sp. ML3W]